MNSTKNLYEILEVSCYATLDEIKVAYKKLVRIYHPDVNKEKNAEISFKLLNNAYEILSDKEKRKNYDLLLNIKKPENFNLTKKPDIKFDYKKTTSNFNYKKTEKIDEQSIIKEVKITEKEALSGTSRIINILNTQTCPKCMGNKFINGVKCSFCHGEGEKKEHKKTEIKIEKGIKNNELIYVGKINSSNVFDKKLFLKIKIEPTKKLYFEDNKVFVRVEIPVYDTILGCKKEISIDSIGLVEFEIPPLTKPNSKIKLNTESEYDCYATIDVIFPENISYEEKKLYDRIRQIHNGERNAC